MGVMGWMVGGQRCMGGLGFVLGWMVGVLGWMLVGLGWMVVGSGLVAWAGWVA